MSETAKPWSRRDTIGTVLLVLVGITAIAFAEGQYLLHDYREHQRMKTDPHVVGEVVKMEPNGETIHDDPVMLVTVTFRTLEGETVRATTRERVDAESEKWLHEHPEVDVWYAPATPTDAVVHWSERMKKAEE